MFLVGCTGRVTPAPQLPASGRLPETAAPVTAAATPLPSPTPTPGTDTGWLPVRTGLETRILTIPTDSALTERVTMVRLDPALWQINIAYRPGESQSLASWQQATGADLVVNGGFFTPENVATGLVVVDGEASGQSYERFGGMLVVSDDGVEIWPLAERPYQSDAAIQYGLQSFPMLVQGGKAVFSREDGQRARRTAVAVDRNGRLLFITAEQATFTLATFSHFLAGSELEIETALNLDGGTSTGLLLTSPPIQVPAYSLLPIVITASPAQNNKP